MEATWSTMEKKEKIMWIKKAAEDQKRYEVGTNSAEGPGDPRVMCVQHWRWLTGDLTPTERPVWDALACSHHRLREEDEVWGRAQETAIVSPSPPACLCCLFCGSFWSLTYVFFDSPGTDIRSSLRRCCPTESWITSRWKSGWLRSAAAGRGYRWRRRTATRRSLRRSRGSTKFSWSSGSL